MKSIFISILSFSLILFANLRINGQTQRDLVEGNLINFSDNNGWCWYQDERAVIDSLQNKLVLGGDASSAGVGGSPRNGSVDAVIFDLNTMTPQRYQLMSTSCDDHNAPGFLVRPDGKYLAMYAEHYDYYNSRYRIFDGNSWTTEQRFDWTTIPGGTDYTIAYSNLYYLSTEGRIYNFARANHRSPNFIYSMDNGDTWLFGGQLSTNSSDSYNKGYYKYWGNGVDRIDFIFTEQHPRDTSTSIYHGYIKGGKTYRSDGVIVDTNVFDTLTVPSFENFTKVFADNTVINSVAMRRCWNTDLVRYSNGTIVTIITARDNDNNGGGSSTINPEHSFIYCRYNGSVWSYTYLGKAGQKLYASEQDYTGLAAVHPTDPNVIYISSTYDPRDNTFLTVHEIFKGVTTDSGSAWNWTPITKNSVKHNIRPVVPQWNSENNALLWMRGTYNSAQSFDMSLVGTIENSKGSNSLMTFVNATLTNTTLSNGSPIGATGPTSTDGAADGLWHIRSEVGNGNQVLASAELAAGENAQALKTRVTVPGTGTYDVWVNFYGNTTADWRIKAGLSADKMRVFRSVASQQVTEGNHSTPLILTAGTNISLYQAYVGQVNVISGNAIDIFVDDEAIRTGSTALRGNIERTWYDGISYSKVYGSKIDANEDYIEFACENDTIDTVGVFSETIWQISTNYDWIHTSILAGANDSSIIISVDGNLSDTIREGKIELTAANAAPLIITVRQFSCVSSFLTVSDTVINIGNGNENKASFNVQSNTQWQISGAPEWLITDITSGINNRTINITAESNPLVSNRVATLSISANNVPERTIEITQIGDTILIAAPIAFEVPYYGNKFAQVSITCNTSWTISFSEPWIHSTTESGSNNGQILVVIDTNNTTLQRESSIQIIAAETIMQEINVIQAPMPVVGLPIVSADDIQIYPNPVTDKLFVKIKDNKSSDIRIYTLAGELIYTETINNSITEFDLSDFVQGVYLIKINNSEENFVKRFIKN